MCRGLNDKVDAIAKLTASLTLPDEKEIPIIIGERHLLASALGCFDEIEEINMVSVFEVGEEAYWREPFFEYIQYGILSTDPKKKLDVK